MNHVKIIGTGSSVPNNVVTNKKLSEWVDTSDEWIRSRTGIEERRLSDGVTASKLGLQASLKALENAEVKSEEIDLIIVATMTPDYNLPNTACLIQRDLKAYNATAFDISAACSGFVYSLNTAVQFIKTGTYKTVLVVGTEVLSKLIDWQDRGTCVLFGDGAGAVVLKESESEGFISMEMGSDGRMSDALLCKSRGIDNPLIRNSDKGLDFMSMKGQEIFKFVCSTIPNNISNLFKRTEYKLEDVTHFVLHQANKRIIQAVAKRLKVDEDKFYTNLEYYGNTSAASIPIALDEGLKGNIIKKNDLIVMSGFGGGLTWGSTLIKI